MKAQKGTDETSRTTRNVTGDGEPMGQNATEKKNPNKTGRAEKLSTHCPLSQLATTGGG